VRRYVDVRISQVHPLTPARSPWEREAVKNGKGESPGQLSPSKSLPHEARREPRSPEVGRFDFFSQPQGDRRTGDSLVIRIL